MLNLIHKGIVPECEGCTQVIKETGDKKLICSYHLFPHMQWLGGFVCKDCSYIEKEEDEDPIKDP